MNFTGKHIAQLNKRLGGSIQQFNSDRILQFHNAKGHGKIIGVPLSCDITYLQYELNTVNEVGFTYDLGNSQIYFLYCCEGSISYQLKDGTEGKIEELQTGILGGDTEIRLKIPGGETTKFSVIAVSYLSKSDARIDQELELNRKLFKRFVGEDKDVFCYVGTLNLRIREQLGQIDSVIQERGLIRSFLLKGIVHFTLALEIQQFDRDQIERAKPATSLTKKELLRIEDASKEIKNRPEFAYSIAYFSRKYGLSPSKLQEGFKALYGTTTTSYIKDKRVETAEKLIRNTDMNISEVVYSVGFTSRSYFSKIFKNRFKCSPKQYQERCKAKGTSVGI